MKTGKHTAGKQFHYFADENVRKIFGFFPTGRSEIKGDIKRRTGVVCAFVARGTTRSGISLRYVSEK